MLIWAVSFQTCFQSIISLFCIFSFSFGQLVSNRCLVNVYIFAQDGGQYGHRRHFVFVFLYVSVCDLEFFLCLWPHMGNSRRYIWGIYQKVLSFFIKSKSQSHSIKGYFFIYREFFIPLFLEAIPSISPRSLYLDV